MKRILTEIQDGSFAREWLLENRVNAPSFKAQRRRERAHPVEEIGHQLGTSCPGSTPRKFSFAAQG